MHGGDRSGDTQRGVYTRRRILAVLLGLLLLALLVPRACQALMGGSNDAAGSRGKQETNAAETDAGTGGGGAGAADTNGTSASDASAANANTDQTKESSEDDSGAPFLDDRARDDNGAEAGAEAAPDLLALLAPTTLVATEEALASGESESAGAPSPSETGDETQASQPPTTEPQNFLIARREAAEQPSSGEESTPAPPSKKRAAPAAVELASTPRTENVRERRELTPAMPVVPAAVNEAVVSQTRVEPAVVDTAATLPAAAATPVPAAPAALQNHASFVPSPARGVAARVGGNTVGGAFGGAGAIGPAPAALPAGPRLAAPRPAALRLAAPRPAALRLAAPRPAALRLAAPRPAAPRLAAPRPAAARLF
jgi:hypothetical protein